MNRKLRDPVGVATNGGASLLEDIAFDEEQRAPPTAFKTIPLQIV